MSESKALRVVLTSVGPYSSEEPFKERKLLLTKDKSVAIGRASHSQSSRNAPAAPNNAYLANPVVSRDHARLTTDETKKLYITDNKSLHGTQLNGINLLNLEPYTVTDGDVITVGMEVTRGPDKFPAPQFRITVRSPTPSPAPRVEPQPGTFSVPLDLSDEASSDEEEAQEASDNSLDLREPLKANIKPFSIHGSQEKLVDAVAEEVVQDSVPKVSDDCFVKAHNGDGKVDDSKPETVHPSQIQELPDTASPSLKPTADDPALNSTTLFRGTGLSAVDDGQDFNEFGYQPVEGDVESELDYEPSIHYSENSDEDSASEESDELDIDSEDMLSSDEEDAEGDADDDDDGDGDGEDIETSQTVANKAAGDNVAAEGVLPTHQANSLERNADPEDEIRRTKLREMLAKAIELQQKDDVSDWNTGLPESFSPDHRSNAFSYIPFASTTNHFHTGNSSIPRKVEAVSDFIHAPQPKPTEQPACLKELREWETTEPADFPFISRYSQGPFSMAKQDFGGVSNDVAECGSTELPSMGFPTERANALTSPTVFGAGDTRSYTGLGAAELHKSSAVLEPMATWNQPSAHSWSSQTLNFGPAITEGSSYDTNLPPKPPAIAATDAPKKTSIDYVVEQTVDVSIQQPTPLASPKLKLKRKASKISDIDKSEAPLVEPEVLDDAESDKLYSAPSAMPKQETLPAQATFQEGTAPAYEPAKKRVKLSNAMFAVAGAVVGSIGTLGALIALPESFWQ